jgi:hypothetical protein
MVMCACGKTMGPAILQYIGRREILEWNTIELIEMKYFNGDEIRKGDKVQADGMRGKVVELILDSESSILGPDISRGVVVDTEEAGWVVFQEGDEDLALIERSIDIED